MNAIVIGPAYVDEVLTVDRLLVPPAALAAHPFTLDYSLTEACHSPLDDGAVGVRIRSDSGDDLLLKPEAGVTMASREVLLHEARLVEPGRLALHFAELLSRSSGAARPAASPRAASFPGLYTSAPAPTLRPSLRQ